MNFINEGNSINRVAAKPRNNSHDLMRQNAKGVLLRESSQVKVNALGTLAYEIKFAISI